jgi:predicted amidophosphoribosyltransferase
LFWYTGRSAELIKAFKYRGKWMLGALVADMLCEASRRREDFSAALSADLVVCVPASDGAISRRGYHQTALIARRLARRIGLPFSLRALGCASGAQTPQASLRTVREREGNVMGAFRARSLVAGKRILIVDDVVTTSATLVSAARELSRAGASSVSAVTVCRAPQFFRYRMISALGARVPTSKATAS